MEKFWLKKYPVGIHTDADVSQYKNIVDVIEESCRTYKGTTAFMNMGVRMSYEELESQTLHMATFFQQVWGLKKGDVIAIQMPNCLQYPVAIFGALRAGLIVVNVNPLYTPREMQFQIKDSGAKAIIIMANFASKLQEILHETGLQKIMVTDLGDCFPFPKKQVVNFVLRHVKKMVPSYSLPHDTWSKVFSGRQAGSLQKPTLTFNDTAFYQYTGGTTGVSKGAVLSHGNIVANMEQISEWMKPKLEDGQEVIITALPLYHIFSLTVNCLGLFKRGMNNVLITNPRDIPGLIKEINAVRPTVMTVVSTLLGALLENPAFATIKLDRLKVSVAGGMALKGAVALKWQEKTKTPVLEGYGLTEASPVVSCNPLDGTDQLGTIGLPLPSTEIKIIDEEGRELPVGEEGELCCRGPQVMKGYLNQPEETRKVITPDGWLKTGDMAVMKNDGFLKIVDRKKDLILVSGFKVFPNEVEEVMMHHPGVAEVAAIGIPDAHSGEVVKLFIVPRNPQLTTSDIFEYAKSQLTGYKRPKEIEFRSELPKTNVGKILRRALRA